MIKLLIYPLLLGLLTGCSRPVPLPLVAPTAMTPEPSDAHIKIQCLVVESALPPSVTSSGTLVLDSRVDDGYGRYKNLDTYFMDMAARSSIQVVKSRENLADFAVSPDRRWIAYSQNLSDVNQKNPILNLVIAMGDNQVIKVLPWEEDWQSYNWLDNQQIVIVAYSQANRDVFARLDSISFLLLNPFTGERKNLPRDFPNMYDLPPLPNWDGWVETVYSPSMTRAVYLKGDVSGPLYYVLWDPQQSKEVSNVQIIGDLDAIPRWSPNGERFAFAPSLFLNKDRYPSYELFSVDTNGKMTQLTHLADYYPRVYIDDLSWSPDGRYIAFWYSSWQDTTISFDVLGNRNLAVLDTTTGWVTDYCINGEDDASIGLRIYPPPLWSPDNNQVVVQSQVSKNSFQTVLVDIEENRAFRIAEDLEPVGWLTAP